MNNGWHRIFISAQIAGNRQPSTDEMVLTSQREVEKSGLEKSEVEEGEMEDSEVEEIETEKNELKESNHFEDCN